MWKILVDKYFLSFTVKSHEYEIIVTDFISLWTATYSEKAFVDLLKNSNVGLSLENDKEFVTNGLLLLHSAVDDLKTLKIEEEAENLLMTIKVVTDYPFGLKCTLSKCSKQLFFEKVTQPILKTVSELKTSQDMLINLLSKKDKEIKAYKRELDNRKIIFPHEETKQFNEEEHRKIFPAYAENFGSTNIPDSIFYVLPQNSRTQDIKQEPNTRKQDTDSIKQDPDNIKQEPDSINQEADSITQESQNINDEYIVVKRIFDSMSKRPHSIKQESDSVTDESNLSLLESSNEITSMVASNSKPEVRKPDSSQRIGSDRRKKLKLSY